MAPHRQPSHAFSPLFIAVLFCFTSTAFSAVIPGTNSTSFNATGTNSTISNATGTMSNSRLPKDITYENWKAGPGGRGTLGLLTSCGLTLALCVWSTVHVNVETDAKPNETLTRIFNTRVDSINEFLAKRWVRKLGWSFVGLFIPEVPVCVAIHERKVARLLQAAMAKHGSWNNNLALSYFAVMGGLRVADLARKEEEESKVEEPASLFGRRKQPKDRMSRDLSFTLTPHGVLFLASRGVPEIINLKPSHVTDRSKAGFLAKAIVVYQALWMVVQVGARAAGGKQVSMLEVHTILHVLCSLAMYIIWWNKPVDIEFQTTIYVKKELLRDLQRGPRPRSSEAEGKVPETLELEAGPVAPNDPQDGPPPRLSEIEGKVPETLELEADEPAAPTRPENVDESNAPQCSEIGHEVTNAFKKKWPQKITVDTTRKSSYPPAEPLPEPQYSLVADAYLCSRAGLGKLAYFQLCEIKRDRKSYETSRYFAVISAGYITLIEAYREIWKESLFLTFLGLVYGGGHLTTWNNKFPSDWENVMWKVCSIVSASTVGGFVFLVFVGLIIKDLAERKDERGKNKKAGKATQNTGDTSENATNDPEKPENDQVDVEKKKKEKRHKNFYFALFEKFCGITLGVGIFPAIFARIFLLVECVISVRKLPTSTYEPVAWADMWPHFT